VTRVLVVEDDPDIREVLVEALRDDGYVVDWADDGREGLAKAREAPPDLAIIDLMIPGLNGREFIRECRSDPQCASLNVIVVSAFQGDRVADLDAQAVIQKPFNLSVLMDTVAQYAPPPVLESR
jgi:DNA-binding response OmpR family regulator